MNTRRTTDAAGETWRKWGNDRPPADALHVDEEPAPPVHRDERADPGAGCALLIAMAVGMVLGAAFILTAQAIAAPRPATNVIPTGAFGSGMPEAPKPASSGNLSSPTGAPLAGIRPGTSEETGAPTSLRGVASWYDDGPGLYAAVHSWRWGDRRYQVVVSSGGRSVVVTVRDFCGCPGGRVIDLSPAAFRRLAPLSAGLVRVTVSGLAPAATPPATDVTP